MLFDRADVAATLAMAQRDPDDVLVTRWVERFGFDRLDRLKGDYCLVRWEADAKRLTLLVAPMSTRLLYFSETGGDIVFSNNLPRLLALPAVSSALDPAALAFHLMRRPLGASASIYRDVTTVAPGVRAIIQRGRIDIRPYWTPSGSGSRASSNAEAYVEQARSLLERAVARRVVDAEPTALALSGGLDSTAIAATLARRSDTAVDCFTIVPPSAWRGHSSAASYADERDKVRALHAMYPHLRIELCESDSISAIERDPTPLFDLSAQPMIGVHHTGWFDPLYRNLRDRGYRRLLTGAWGNFTLSYSGGAGIGELLKGGRLGALAAILPRLARSEGRSVASLLRGSIGPNLPTGVRSILRRVRNPEPPWVGQAAINPDLASAMRLTQALLACDAEGQRLGNRGILDDYLFVRRPQILANAMALGRHYGFKMEEPLADQDLVAFLAAQPAEHFLRDGRRRALARDVLTDRLPAEIVNDTWMGLQNPGWFDRFTAQRGLFLSAIEEARAGHLASVLLDLPRLERLLRDWPEREPTNPGAIRDYQHLLPRAVQMARFLAWAEQASSARQTE